jgi:hypothetical protein
LSEFFSSLTPFPYREDDLKASVLHRFLNELGPDIASLLSDAAAAIFSLLVTIEANEYQPLELINDVCNAVLADKTFASFDESSQETLRERLRIFLEHEGRISLSIKAADLSTEGTNVFLNSRILSDIRPIFDSKVENGIIGAVVVHSLKIEYQEGNFRKEFYVTLDNLDLRKLSEDISRAVAKSKVINDYLGRSGTQPIGSSIWEDR